MPWEEAANTLEHNSTAASSATLVDVAAGMFKSLCHEHLHVNK